jgi:hypothetical protein
MVASVDVGRDPNPPGDGGGPGPGPGPAPTPGPLPSPRPTPETPTATHLSRLPTTTLARFLKRGGRIRSRCEFGLRGTVKLQLARTTARRLGLRKHTTLVRIEMGSEAAKTTHSRRLVLKVRHR